MTANKNIPMNLSKYGGAYNGALIDSAVQEYNLKTGKLLRNWDALDHIPLSESQATLPTNGFPWDAYHVNSIDLTGNGTFLVSMRDTWAAYLVNIDSGKIEWTLGGKHSSFKFGPGAAFQWQHDVALQPGSTVSLFDDHCCQLTGGGTYVPPTGPSRGLVLKLDQQRAHGDARGPVRRRRRLRRRIHGRHPAAAERQRVRRLGLGTVLLRVQPLGQAAARRRTSRARPQLPGDARAVGRPAALPARRRRPPDGRQDTVYASWNGATQVASWRVLAGAGAGRLSAVASAAKSGFETAIPVPQGYTSFEVQALDADGRVIGASRPFTSDGDLDASDDDRSASMTIRAGVLLAALAICVGLCACGRRGSSASAAASCAARRRADHRPRPRPTR